LGVNKLFLTFILARFSLLVGAPLNLPSFQPGGIHANLDFWDHELQAGKWVLDLLHNGYRVPFQSEPMESELDNNATVRHNLQVAEEQVLLLLQQGVLRKVDFKPHCVNPLGLVTKTVNNVVKHRLIFDGSRLINEHVNPPTVKLAHLQKALLKLQKHQLLGVFDLKSCYFHVRLDPSLTEYFGVKLAIGGVDTYMVYDYLPFGLSSAVHCITKLWKPIVSYLQKKGIPLSVYIDDGFFGAQDGDSWNQVRLLIWETISRAGWTIEKDKSDAENQGSMSKHYLGFAINTRISDAPTNSYEEELVKMIRFQHCNDGFGSKMFDTGRVGSILCCSDWVGSGQTSLVWVWIWKISPKNPNFFPSNKKCFVSGQKVPGSRTGRPFIYCGSKV